MQRAVRYHTSPVPLFSISLVCLLFLFFFFFPPHSHTALRIHSVSFLATSFFSSAPGTRAPTQQRGYLGSATISRRALSRNAPFSSIVHECRRRSPRSSRLEATISTTSLYKIYYSTRNLLHTRTLLVDSTVTDSSTMNAHGIITRVCTTMYVLRLLI